MDEISRLLRMARLDASLDRRCRLGGSTRMEVASEGPRAVPFHVLLEGQCTLEVGGELYPMSAGDVVVIPSNAGHRILTAGGPLDQTHLFATWAFKIGIEGSDIPLGASVSLFMAPILAVAAFFILRDVTKRGNEA